jgi:hypothetical protein
MDGCTAKEAPAPATEPVATRLDWYMELRMRKAALVLSRDGNSHGLVVAGLPRAKHESWDRESGRHQEGGEVTGEEEVAELTFSGSIRRSYLTLVAPVRANVPESLLASPSHLLAEVGDDVIISVLNH